ncbi:MAG: hypothetical protein JNM18_13905, partial [Planctomycetaceae bacterium]|nr:hypothetical protein [Planctomycetaceae bacterium]
MKPSNSTAVGLVALFALSTALQGWMIFHARLPAVDAVNFVAHAQLIERDGMWATLRTEPAPPLYPLAVLAVRGMVSAVGGELSWALSAQIAAAIPLVLCIVPVFLIARQALELDTCSRTRHSSGTAPLPTPRTLASSATKDCSAAWVATLLFVVMTQVARMGAEALSDSTH